MPTRHLRTLAALTLALALLSACARTPGRASPGSSAAPGTTVETIMVGGATRQYLLHVPAGAGQGQPAALVLNLHGYSSSAAQQEQVSQMSAKADSAGFIVAYPEALGAPPSWKFGDRAEGRADVAFIRDLIAKLSSQLNIDPARVYLAGISNGAEMSYRLTCDLGGAVAAFATVAGGYPLLASCQSAPATPAVAFHGTADAILAYAGRPPLLLPVRDWAASWAAHNRCAPAPSTILQQGEVTGEQWGGCAGGADVVLYTIEGKGHSWPGSRMPASITTRAISATDIIWDFFAAHPRQPPA